MPGSRGAPPRRPRARTRNPGARGLGAGSRWRPSLGPARRGRRPYRMTCARFRDVDNEDPFFQGTGRGRRPTRPAVAGAWGHRGPTGPSGRWIRAFGWRPGASPRLQWGRCWGQDLRDWLARGRRRAGPDGVLWHRRSCLCHKTNTPRSPECEVNRVRTHRSARRVSGRSEVAVRPTSKSGLRRAGHGRVALVARPPVRIIGSHEH